MALGDTAIVATAELKSVRRGGRDVFELMAEVTERLLLTSGWQVSEIDGLIVGPTMTGMGNRYFWPQVTADYLGLELDFCDVVDLGGSSVLAAVARASAALDAGLCNSIMLLFVDAWTENPTPSDFAETAFMAEFTVPQGQLGPPGAFGLISQRYDEVYGLDEAALAKLAVTQRDHALLNENACDVLRIPLTEDDYRQSRRIADPIRLLDCVMPCDGGSGLLLTTRERARQKGVEKFAVPLGYGERTNFRHSDPIGEMLESGHNIAGERALHQAGLTLDRMGSVHPYDDFLVAIILQLESLGFCAAGKGCAFVRDTNLRFDGDLPLNTGGGQISSGQPGAGAGAVNLVEGVRQVLGQAGPRQVARSDYALVTGIGWIPYLRNWTTSNVLVVTGDG